jgi:hypothetical protein
LLPRHKRLKKSSRLQAAKDWISKYNGKNLLKGYSKHFAVDKLCAVKELSLLGYETDVKYVEELKRSIEVQVRLNQKRKELREENLRIETYEYPENMYFTFEEYFQEDNYDFIEANYQD